jgi:hypothetical protein
MFTPSIRRLVSGAILAVVAIVMSGCVVYPAGPGYYHPYHYWRD